MANRIVTNSCIGTDQDLKSLVRISIATAREKYADKVSEEKLEAYIQQRLNYHALRGEVNNMANQFLLVWVDGEIGGYARVTTKGERPEFLHGKSAVRIADFNVLERFNEIEVKRQLFERCLCLCSTQQTVWMAEYNENADMDFFESYGFIRNAEIAGSNDLDLPVVHLQKGEAAINDSAYPGIGACNKHVA